MRQTICLLLSLFSFFLAFGQIEFVNPFIGTDAHGHTYPGAATPFGMVQLSPDTRADDSWDGCSGYHFSDDKIFGFSHTHLSGTGVPDYCDVLVQPYVGELSTSNIDYASGFDKKTEVAEAGFYSVFLDKPKVKVELTASPRVGVHRYTFSGGQKENKLLVDLNHRDLVLDAGFFGGKMKNEIRGKRISRSWATEQHIYFVMRFSQPIKNVEGTDRVNGFVFENTGEPLVVTVGLSATSAEAAAANLSAEAVDFDFDRYKKEAQLLWTTALAKVAVESDNVPDKTVFYTALYHSMLAPNIYNDVAGTYRGRDNKIHSLPRGQKGYYTVFSLWDTYRALHPLLTILEPERTQDFIRTFLLQYEQGGRLPIWELGANETDCMIGNHAIPVIADAWLKGLTNYDGKKALEAMVFSQTQERLGLDVYQEMGFIPAESESESVSKTLEYAFDDFAIAKMAESLGDEKTADEFFRRSQNWKNIYDPSTGFMRARNNNTWHTPFDPTEVNFNYTEANAWQYRLAMPHDIETFIEKIGGPAAFEKELDALFTASSTTSGREQADITGLVGQYAQGNEPSHHMAYLYHYIGKPAKAQAILHKIREELYTEKADGLCGNEDCGQMSAWMVFNAMGFYPVVPVGGEYALNTPWFDKMSINLDNGKSFEINRKTSGKAPFYIKKVEKNGKAHTQSFIQHSDIMNGGALTVESNANGDSQWATSTSDSPSAKIVSKARFVPVPFVELGGRVFDKSQYVTLNVDEPNATMYFTMDGTTPTQRSRRYSKPIFIKKTGEIRAIAVHFGVKSPVMIAKFNRLNKKLNISKYNCTYSNQYTGRGEKGLVDGLRGGADFRSGGWQGFRGQHFDVVLDLGKKKRLRKIGLSALQDENSWIFFPKNVQFEVSNDGKSWKSVGQVATAFDPLEKGGLLQDFEVVFSEKIKAKYVRIFAESLIECPSDHKGAGYDGWVFVDEVWAE